MSKTDERRQEIRTALPVQLWFNLLESADEYLRLHSPAAVFESPDLGPGLEGRDDMELFLLKLDKKLDQIIALLTDKISRKDYRYKGRVIDISESGLRFVSPVDLPEGAALEMGLIVPQQPHKTMDMAGKVIWVSGQGILGRPERQKVIGVKFTDILPADQDEIVHYIFQKQREEIRRSRERE